MKVHFIYSLLQEFIGEKETLRLSLNNTQAELLKLQKLFNSSQEELRTVKRNLLSTTEELNSTRIELDETAFELNETRTKLDNSTLKEGECTVSETEHHVHCTTHYKLLSGLINLSTWINEIY